MATLQSLTSQLSQQTSWLHKVSGVRADQVARKARLARRLRQVEAIRASCNALSAAGDDVRGKQRRFVKNIDVGVKHARHTSAIIELIQGDYEKGFDVDTKGGQAIHNLDQEIERIKRELEDAQSQINQCDSKILQANSNIRTLNHSISVAKSQQTA